VERYELTVAISQLGRAVYARRRVTKQDLN